MYSVPQVCYTPLGVVTDFFWLVGYSLNQKTDQKPAKPTPLVGFSGYLSGICKNT